MRVIAVLSLIIGFITQGLLDGQTFTHAVIGIVCGIIALGSGSVAAQKDPPHIYRVTLEKYQILSRVLIPFL